jgi:hypothetical protein
MGWEKIIRHFVVVSAVLLLAFSAWGQAMTSLRGMITDPSGAAIPNATIHLVNADTNIERTTSSDAQGEYVFTEVLPGNYELVVEATGFAKHTQEKVTLLVHLPATINVAMKVGTAQETVTVTEQAPIINRTDATVGQTMGTVEMENLPLQAENMNLLLSLQAGVVYNGENLLTGYYDTRAGAVNGERSDQNNITLDGVSNNDEFNGFAFNGILPSTPFSVEEFRVTTSNYGATEGRSSGAQMALVTKGGTNNFHGSLYEFNRNTLGEANDWFLIQSEAANGQPNVPQHLVRNIYGGTIGGPIKKDRFFFFFNYEGRRQTFAQSVERAIPSSTLRDGIIEYGCASPALCPGMNVKGVSGTSYAIPAGFYALGPTDLTKMDPLGIGPSPGALAYMNTYPQPNDPNYGDAPNFAGYRFGAPTKLTDNWYIGRLDYKITQNGNHMLFIRGEGVDDRNANPPFVPGRPPTTTTVDLAKGFVAGYTAVLGPHWVNNFRYGLTRDSYGSNGDSTLPWIFFRDMDQDVYYSSGDTSPVYNIVDTLSWQKGTHNFQFGGNILLSRLNSWDTGISYSDGLTNADWIAAGGFANKNDGLNPACIAEFGPANCTAADVFPAVAKNFNHSYDFPLAAMMGIVSEVDGVFNYKIANATSASSLSQGIPIRRNWATGNYNLFFQDTWQARRNLSITYGLNYQLMTPMTETNGQQVTPSVNMGAWFAQRAYDMARGIPDNQVMGGALIGFSPSGSYYGKTGLYNLQTKNFAPRLGFAWTPESNWGLLKSLLGEGKTVVRAGFGMYYDNFGPELAQSYSSVGEYGLSTDVTNPSATMTLAGGGPDQSPRIGNTLADMNNVPLSVLDNLGLTPASSFNFPSVPSPGGFAIAHGIDQSVKTPYSYAADFSIQRELPGGMTLDLAYVGHFAHRLLSLDDIASPMNLVDTKSKIDYFTAAKQLSKLWRSGVTDSTFTDSMVGPTAAYWQDILTQQATYKMCSTGATTADFLLAVFDNAGPGCGTLYNETSENFDFDVLGIPSYPVTGAYSVYNSQYSSLWAWKSMSWSNYSAFELGLHRQMTHGLLFGFNYTYAHALDVESMAERGVHYLTDSVINAWDPRQMYGPADFDLRHQVNGYWVANLPFGKGRLIGQNVNGWVDALIGGWQLGGTGRWTSGFATSVFQGYVWPTNWDEMGWSDVTGQPIVTGRTIVNGYPNIFRDPTVAALGFDYAYPGESGIKNNVRGDGFFGLDMNLAKQWKIPHMESKSIEARWSVFNVTNSVRFDAYSMQDEWDAASSFGNYTTTITNPRVMEFALIFHF